MRALVLLYYFPPSGGPGVQRGLKLVRGLPLHGIEPIVVTVAPEVYRGPGEYPPDPSMQAEVPASLRIVRTTSGDRPRLKAALQGLRLFRLARHVLPRLFFERQASWYEPALAACLREIERMRPDVVLTSSQPYVAHLVGRELQRRVGIPWVADFRDPWTLAWGRSWPSRRAFAWEDLREDEVLADADRVIVNTSGSALQLAERRPWIASEKVAVVANGYDPEDLAVAPAARDPDEFLVVHTGAFRAPPPGRGRRGLRALLDTRGFAPVPYDLSTHSPETLFRVLAAGGGRAAGRRIRARLVGPLDVAWMEFARSLGIDAHVEPLGYRPHREATAHLLAADLLYLPTITRTDGGSVANVPAKTYEYLGSGRPIAALAGSGDVRELAAANARCALLDPRDENGLTELLRLCATGNGPAATPPDPPDAHPWRRDEIARRVAGVLRSVCGIESSSDE